VVAQLNRTVRGWANYFSYGSASKVRHVVELHLYHSVRNFLRRRHQLGGLGTGQFPAHRVFGELGVISFDPTYRRFSAHASA
jgi:RNA-directed DNA polymerase